MNASEMATNLEFASKIATVVNLFKFEFPDARSDLKPWKNDPQTRELIDPDSIDIGFHFPGISKSWQSRSILIQIRFYHDPISNLRRAIGLEVSGFNHLGEQWRLSTVENWNFVGASEPIPEIGDKLKLFCRQVLEIFNG
ncbi:hypothetical protein WA1_35320 [Scytonema hofmannii PCC 7110]|uniref:Uncharacterized protein n=1 Tax=Scytonema hofmannii PCC 7110 TaxID=128403 RepID=A0A139X182_9CYAN|nr:hypothetical protein [Scytonema hofmannii]KYC38469.1 hypothetical protein WA1_35320 [Scytonema hofmannii PCC 7110]